MKVLLRFAIVAQVLLLVVGCAARKVPPPSPAPGAPVSPPATVAPPPPAGTVADNNYLEGFSMMSLGKYERALELFAEAWKQMPGHPGVAENFPAALEGLKKSGDEAQRQGRPEEALDLLPRLEERADQLALKAMALNDRGDATRSQRFLAELASLPGPYARLREGETEAYLYQIDNTGKTIDAINEAGTVNTDALKLAKIAIVETKVSPFLAARDAL